MCGICIVIEDRDPVDPGLIRRMCDRIVHRGPDSGGYHHRGGVALGMRRLKVIDLEGGDQPIFNEDRTLAIVFNGEIYNYRTLRDDLIARGHRFRTASDTEVILHLYEEYGLDALPKLRGMFAFAVHHLDSDRVVIARDRLGIKPLYYAVTPQGLAAASEIKSLLEVPSLTTTVDEVALDQYFSLLYIPAPLSIFREIRKLPPGHVLVKERGREPVLQRYWSLASKPRQDASEAALVEEFRERFDDAVQSHLVADVPLGVFLSGGIDSGGVVASMARTNADIRTLSLGFPPEYGDFDEREAARLVARRYGTQHEEIVVEPKIESTIHALADTFDEPLADSGAVPNYLICKAARSHVTVALSGLGGDELSAGYQRYLGVELAERYRPLLRWLPPTLIRGLVGRIPEPKKGGRSVDRLKRFVEYASLPRLERFYAFSSPMDRDRREALYSQRLGAQVELDSALGVMQRIAAGQPEADAINELLCVDIETYMVDDLLAVADRTSMASALEVRVPFLDHPLVEFMAGVPGEMKIRGSRTKHFLKEAFAQDLPSEILTGKKSGFSLPVARWLRQDLRELIDDTLSDSRLARDGLFDRQVVSELKREHFSRQRDRSTALWALLMFHLWADRYGG